MNRGSVALRRSPIFLWGLQPRKKRAFSLIFSYERRSEDQREQQRVADNKKQQLTIWGRANSVNVQKVLWCLAELEVPYQRIDAGMAFGQNDTAEYLAMNPN